MTKNQISSSDWLKSCVDQSIVCASWKKTESKACDILSQKYTSDNIDSLERQAIVQALSTDYIKKHFPGNIISDNMRVKKGKKSNEDSIQYVIDILESESEGRSNRRKKNRFLELSSFRDDASEIVDNNFQQLFNQRKLKKNRMGNFSSIDIAVDLLNEDTSVLKHMCSKLQAESVSVPDRLRYIIWMDCLQIKEESKDQHAGSSVKMKKRLMQLSKRVASASHFDVQSAVRKACKESSYLRQDSSDNFISYVIDIVSLYCSYNRNSTSNCIFWAMPIQHVLPDEKDDDSNSGTEGNSDDDDEIANDEYQITVINSVMLLEKMLRLCSLSVDDISDVASRVIETFAKEDREFISHLRNVVAINIPSVIKVFSSDILSLDKRKAQVLQDELLSKEPIHSEDAKNIITKPEIFLRKWISEVFVGVLNQNSLMFIWDQLFMTGWKIDTVQNICLSLFGLLRTWFMVAKDYVQVQKVFLEEPQHLYTLDIVRAYRHVKKRRRLSDLAAMNQNVYLPDIPPEPTPPPPPPPPPVEQKPTPAPSPPPPPKPVTPPVAPSITQPVLSPPMFVPWVPYDKEKSKSQMPTKPKFNQPFDIYVDGVQFLPDNATIIKITGKVWNIYLHKKDESIKLQGYPVLDSPRLYPKFTLKQTVNRDSQPINPDIVIMFRVYTLERHSKEQTVLGSCLFCPFSNKQGKQATLRVGGHQLRLRHGIPDPDFTVEHMLASHMDNNPIIPGLSILVRVLPYEKNFVTAPAYESHLYRSEFARPNDSEKHLFKHYQESKDWNMTVRDVALQFTDTALSNDNAITRLIVQLLQKEGSIVPDFPYQRFISYNQTSGIMVLADKAAGLPIFLDGRYLQCLVQSFPGEETLVGNGKSQVKSFITQKLDLESTLRAPDWIDKPTKLNLDYDDRAFLLLSLYGLRPRYDPKKKQLIDKDGKEPQFNLENAVAWSVIPCFDRQAVFAGTHHVPLLKGRPPDDIIAKLRYLPFDYFCKQFKTSVKIFDSASIEITIWDGRFANDECPPLPAHMDYLNISPNPNKYLVAKGKNLGQTVAQLLQSGVLNSETFSDHRQEILELLKKVFSQNVNRALDNSGYEPLL